MIKWLTKVLQRTTANNNVWDGKLKKWQNDFSSCWSLYYYNVYGMKKSMLVAVGQWLSTWGWNKNKSKAYTPNPIKRLL